MKGKNRPGNFNFFFLHFEKIVMVILILAAGYCGYKSTNLAKLTWEAPELTSDAERAERHVSQNEVPVTEYLEKMPPIPYTEYTEGIKVPVAATPYATPLKWEPSVFPERVPRGQVRVFPVEKLVATSGIGGIFLKPKDSIFGSSSSNTMQSALGGGMAGGGMPGAGGMSPGLGGGGTGSAIDPNLIQATRWVVLTGLIPSEKQIEEYVRTFANATYSDPTTDTPTYMLYRVYRREVRPDGSESPWVDLKALENFDRHTKTWQGLGADPVDVAYIIPKTNPLSMLMAYPLPSALNKIWGKEAGHPPQIPLMSDSLKDAMAENQKMLLEMLNESQKTITIDDITKELEKNFGSTGSAAGTGRMGGMGGMGGGSMPGMGGMGGGSMPGMGGMGGGMMPGMGGMGSGMSEMGSMGGGMGGTGGTGLQIVLPKNEYQPMVYQKITYSLFRYIDFDVKPGITYQYRVQLALLNPNFKMEAKYLEVPESSDDPFLFTELSEPSAPTSVVSSARVLVHKVNPLPGNRAWEGQTATVASIAFDLDDPAEYVVPSETAIRGRVLNFLKRSGTKYPQSASAASTSMAGMGGPGGMEMGMTSSGNRQQKKPTVESKTLDHKTGVCVADIYGGKALIGSSSDHRIPGQTLMMSYDGTLQIQSVDSDAMEWKRYDPAAAARSAQTMGGGPGMGMMME